jgi:hypothetical protein
VKVRLKALSLGQGLIFVQRLMAFSRVSGLRTELAGCIQTRPVCFAQSNASNQGFSCFGVWKSGNKKSAEKVDMSMKFIVFFISSRQFVR